MDRLLLRERAKWIFLIGLVAIGVGFTANAVITYPTECMQEDMASNLKPLEIANL